MKLRTSDVPRFHPTDQNNTMMILDLFKGWDISGLPNTFREGTWPASPSGATSNYAPQTTQTAPTSYEATGGGWLDLPLGSSWHWAPWDEIRKGNKSCCLKSTSIHRRILDMVPKGSTLWYFSKLGFHDTGNLPAFRWLERRPWQIAELKASHHLRASSFVAFRFRLVLFFFWTGKCDFVFPLVSDTVRGIRPQGEAKLAELARRP